MTDDLHPDTALQLLQEIERDETVTQRSLATRLGIALGLTNAFLRRCIRKGWVKAQKVPPRRYAYFLTPQGFSEKRRLTQQYLARSLHFYRQARAECREALLACRARGWNRVVLYGAGDLAEIATLATRETGVELVGVIVTDAGGRHLTGLNKLQNATPLLDADAVLLTDITQPQESYERLVGAWPPERIHTLPLLHITVSPDRNQ